jgi:hypothetical protein
VLISPPSLKFLSPLEMWSATALTTAREARALQKEDFHGKNMSS